MGRAASLLTVLAAASAMLGFVRDAVIAAVFGAGAAVDVYFVAQSLINIVLALAAGAVAKATVPVVARSVAAGEDEAAHRSAGVALTATVIVLSAGSLVMYLAAGSVVRVAAPGFSAEQVELAIVTTRLLLGATVLIAATNVLAAVANGHHRFFWSGVQGIPFNLSMIAAAALFGPRYGIPALAVGFVVGSLLRLLLQLVPLVRWRMRLRPSLDLADPGFRVIVRMVPPLLAGSAISTVNTLVDRAVGSTVGEGVISALSYGWRVVGTAELLLVASLATAIYPSFAASNKPALQALVGRGFGAVGIVLTPVAVVLVVAAAPIVSLVFGRGAFDAADVALTSTALAWYAPALVALGWREVAARACYAVDDARTPVVVAAFAMVVNVVGDLTLGRIYGVAGLAGSTTLSLFVGAAGTTWLLSRRHGAVAVRPATMSAARIAGAGTLAALAGLAVRAWVGDAPALLAAAAISAAVLVVFFLVLLRSPELRDVRTSLRRRRSAG